MIRVRRVDAPPEFEAVVRAPGRALLDVLTGAAPPAGRWVKKLRVADRLEDIPVKALEPLWQNECLRWLRHAYDDTCAYLGLRIFAGQSRPTVDHFVPKSAGARGRELAYEWSNYRLSALRPNQVKSRKDVLDPFEVEDEWFRLDLVRGNVKVCPSLPDALKAQVCATIAGLGLNDDDCAADRRRIIGLWEEGLSFTALVGCAPFIAREIRRQGGAPGRAFVAARDDR